MHTHSHLTMTPYVTHDTMALPRRKKTIVDQQQTILDFANANIKKIEEIMKVSSRIVQQQKRRYEETDTLKNKRCGGLHHTRTMIGKVCIELLQ